MPVKIGNVILKNHLIATKAISQELQGPENFPAESTIRYIEDFAKNGAAIVTCSVGNFPESREHAFFDNQFDMENRRVLNYFTQMTARIHAHGSLASAGMMCSIPQDVSISEIRDSSLIRKPIRKAGGPGGPDAHKRPVPPEITIPEIKAFISRFASECVAMRTRGFDAVNIYMSYGGSILADSLSPVLNQRIDEYGGTAENRARLTLELYQAIKEACGQDFLIESQISGEEDMPGGYTTDDFLDYAKMCEGLVDIFQIRAKNGALSHASSFSATRHKPTTLKYAEAFKARGIKALCAPSGGYQDLNDIEQYIAEGRTDLVAMARAFICDPQFGQKLYDERGEDVVPCIRCDKCHGAVCSVNPRLGLTHVASEMYLSSPLRSKKIAVIGGGPAGITAALTAGMRGHRVILYEQSGQLGGQLIHADYMAEKWSLKDYKDYLIRNVTRMESITIKLNTHVSVEEIANEDFDAVIAACGSNPKPGPVPGGDDERIWPPISCFGHEHEMGEHIVVIGGASTGAETALYLAGKGHQVTVITRQREIAHDDVSHGHEVLMELLENNDNIKIITRARTTKITDAKIVNYLDTDGLEHIIEANSVVFAAGVAPQTDTCFAYAGLTPEFYIVGDANIQTNNMWCIHDMPEVASTVGGNVMHCTSTAYAAAMQL
jgi:2,4-dienoyl-CoA reductase-like NADH-dependent reductase (Old Yellow Enzyme family)/thioredoxin reductase